MKRHHVPILVLVAAFAVLPATATAQWQWIDRQGKKVFSDQAPPPDIPDRNILQRSGSPAPRTPIDPPAAASGQDATSARTTPATPPKPSGVDRDLEEKTRRAEADEKARQAAESERVARAKAENCARARQGKATYDSGIRVARLNAQGEREVLDDNARAAENQRLQGVIDNDCS